MEPEILPIARQFLARHLRGKTNHAEMTHPWRKGWDFVVLHSLRVEALVQKILASQPHDLAEQDVIALRLAAILHDIARLDGVSAHAQLGAHIVSDWLQANPDLADQIEDPERTIRLIAGHSEKDKTDGDPSSAILKDADLLDEIGIMSLFMAANWVDHSSAFFFHQLYQQLATRELAYCDLQFARLQTRAARLILLQKKEFLSLCLSQLGKELEGDLTPEILQTLAG
jgi:uncharacterized protein